MKTLSIALLLLAACASAPPPSSSPEPAPTPPVDAAPLPPPIDAPPPPVGYRARLMVPPPGGAAEAAGSWIDVEVVGDGDAQRAACEEAVAELTGPLARPGTRVERPCALAPLPAVPVTGVFLVDSATTDRNGVPVRVAEQVPTPSQSECEIARQRREADNERVDSEAQVRAGGVLAGERDRQKELTDRACATEAEVTARCRRATSKRTRERCATEQTSAAQECQRARELLATVEQRVATPVPRPVRAVACQLP
jgi:hypothetical protein